VDRVVPGSAADSQLSRGDVIVEANHRPVRSASDLKAAFEGTKAGDILLLKVQRQGQSRYVGVEKK
jgi:S1-C subfamily serine protease